VLRSVADGNIGSTFGWGLAPFQGGAPQFIGATGVPAFVEPGMTKAVLMGRRHSGRSGAATGPSRRLQGRSIIQAPALRLWVGTSRCGTLSIAPTAATGRRGRRDLIPAVMLEIDRGKDRIAFAVETRNEHGEFGVRDCGHELRGHVNLGALDFNDRIEPVRWCRRSVQRKKRRDNSCVESGDQVRLDVRKEAGTASTGVDIEACHQKFRCFAKGIPLLSTYAFELSRAALFDCSQMASCLSATARESPSSDAFEMLIPNFLALSSRPASIVTLVVLRDCGKTWRAAAS